jgi:hypothetical protein
MSGGGFHVHGPHDHEVEHAAQHEPDGLAGQLAMITAVIATIGALFAYMGGATQANAMLFKNDASIKKTEAANQWAFYQAKSGKQNLAELGFSLSTDESVRAKFKEKMERYESEKGDIQKKAKALDEESAELEKKSDDMMHVHHRWAQATTVLQVSIALAAIALLSRRRWLEWATLGVASAGTVLGILAWLHI